VSLYAFLSQILSPADGEMEKFYQFARYLMRKLESGATGARVDLSGSVALVEYGLDRTYQGSISLSAAEPVPQRGPTAVGTRKATSNEVPLSEVIALLNEKYGQAGPLVGAVMAKTTADPDVRRQAEVNSFDNFALAARAKLLGAIMEGMDSAPDLVAALMNDAEWQERIVRAMLRQIYGEVRLQPPAPASRTVYRA
jgi:type I restriction enzyme, R subunit